MTTLPPGLPGSPLGPSAPGAPGSPLGPSGPGAPAGPCGPGAGTGVGTTTVSLAGGGVGAGVTTVSFFSHAVSANPASTAANTIEYRMIAPSFGELTNEPEHHTANTSPLVRQTVAMTYRFGPDGGSSRATGLIVYPNDGQQRHRFAPVDVVARVKRLQ
jgi:hypothetical protein